jgi:ferredoxin
MLGPSPWPFCPLLFSADSPLMSDRPRGAFIAQCILVVGAVLVFIAIVVSDGIGGLPPDRIAAFGVGLMAAAVSGMLYHLYLGRFEQVWTARSIRIGAFRPRLPVPDLKARTCKRRSRPSNSRTPAIQRSNEILRTCVHCGFCTATCPTYQVLGDELDSPRGRIYLIKDMLENGRPADEKTVKHIDRCLSCLACMTTCPSGVHYMHLVDHAREYIEQTYKRPLFERVLRWTLARSCPIRRGSAWRFWGPRSGGPSPS